MTNKLNEIKELSENWWILLVQGILFILLGLLFAFNPAETIVWMVQLLAFYWIFSGALSMVGAMSDETGGSRVWAFIAGLIGMIAGCVMVSVPFVAAALTATFWMYFMGLASMIYGIATIFGRTQVEDNEASSGWGTTLLGIFNVVFGFVLVGFPFIAAQAYVLVGGFIAIFGGVVLTVLAFCLRSLGNSSEDQETKTAPESKQELSRT